MILVPVPYKMRLYCVEAILACLITHIDAGLTHSSDCPTGGVSSTEPLPGRVMTESCSMHDLSLPAKGSLWRRGGEGSDKLDHTETQQRKRKSDDVDGGLKRAKVTVPGRPRAR